MCDADAAKTSALHITNHQKLLLFSKLSGYQYPVWELLDLHMLQHQVVHQPVSVTDSGI